MTARAGARYAALPAGLLAAAAAEQPEPGRFTQVRGHLLFALATLVVLAVVLLLLRRGWRRRAAAWQDLPAPHPLPDVASADPAPASGPAPMPGLFLGTTAAGQWLERVTVHGLGDRSAGELRLTGGGLEFDLVAGGFLVPRADLSGARVDSAHAGKVVGPRGLLVVRWRLGGHELESGFRADDPDRYAEWVAALGAPAAA